MLTHHVQLDQIGTRDDLLDAIFSIGDDESLDAIAPHEHQSLIECVVRADAAGFGVMMSSTMLPIFFAYAVCE